ncbi:MAG: L,D-transpeptidase family protein [Alphaproteobacteria bacterium]|nr:L,D-transpeptidase family protein [Alphaproteobacteria bacterium]
MKRSATAGLASVLAMLMMSSVSAEARFAWTQDAGEAVSIAAAQAGTVDPSTIDPDSEAAPLDVELEEEVEPEVELLSMPSASAWDEDALQAVAGVLFDAPSHGLPSLDDQAFRIANPTVASEQRIALAQDAFLRFGGWLRFGLVDQESLEPRRLRNAETNILIEALFEGLEAGDLRAALRAFEPNVRDYNVLRAEMIRMRTLQPIWPQIDAGGALEIGASGDRVDQLRRRLEAEGLYRADWSEGDLFDARLETAVRRFQGRVNLSPTGRMDRSTLRQLNISPQDRIAQLRANMEQRRWRDRDLGRRHIWVNIADFRLEAWADGALERVHEVMVGSAASSTPEFSDIMEYLVINPWWGVPGGSARSRFRAIRRNPAIARQRGYRIFDGAGQAVSAYDIDWSRWNNRWPYTLSQAPGPTNPMGEIKFKFPNRHLVYIHDTTERDQFYRTRRDFSAGCIRVEDPMGLAEWVLDGQDGYDRARIDETAAGNTPTVIWLDEQIPVHLAYWTVVGDDDGGVRYLNDLYRRDNPLIDAYRSAYEAIEPDEAMVAASHDALSTVWN